MPGTFPTDTRSSSADRSPRDDRPRRPPAWVGFAVALLVALASGYGIVTLHGRADAARRAQIALLEVDDVLHEYQVVRAQALRQQEYPPTLAAAVATYDTEIADTLRALHRIPGGDAAFAWVDDGFRVYRAGLGESLELIASGQSDEAATVAANRVTPSFAQLSAQVENAVDRYSDVADRSNRVSALGTIVTLTVAAALIGLLFWRVEGMRRRGSARLTFQASHDALTGLPNRALFQTRLAHAMGDARNPGAGVAVVALDVDDFKVVNDSLGDDAGDRLLVTVAERLAAGLQPGDTVARLGGNAFAFLLPGVSDPAVAAGVADRVVERLRVPIDLDGRVVVVSASVGIALGRAPSARPDALLRDADVALHAAKRAGRGSQALFEPGMEEGAWARLEGEADLRRALRQGEFRVHYQPVIDLATGRIAEVEALVRWAHPIRSLLPRTTSST